MWDEEAYDQAENLLSRIAHALRIIDGAKVSALPACVREDLEEIAKRGTSILIQTKAITQ